jgi:hypothetical protein
MFKGDWFDAEYFGHIPSSDGEFKSNYGRNYGGYNGGYAASEQFVEWVLSNFKTRKKKLIITEIGCAQGHTLAEFISKGHQAYGYDISPYIVSTALPDMLPFIAVHDMTEDWEEPVVKSDLVVSKDVLEHVNSEETLKDVLIRIQNTFEPTAQFHVVNTGEHMYQAYGGDMSHGLQMSLSKWQELADSLGLNCTFVFKET